MQAFIKDGKLIINSMILDEEKESFISFVNQAETYGVSATPLYNIEGDKSGIQFEIDD